MVFELVDVVADRRRVLKRRDGLQDGRRLPLAAAADCPAGERDAADPALAVVAGQPGRAARAVPGLVRNPRAQAALIREDQVDQGPHRQSRQRRYASRKASPRRQPASQGNDSKFLQVHLFGPSSVYYAHRPCSRLHTVRRTQRRRLTGTGESLLKWGINGSYHAISKNLRLYVSEFENLWNTCT